VARPRLVCPLEWPDPLVAPVSVETRPLSDVPASAFGRAPPHDRYVTHSNDRGPGAEQARGRLVLTGTIFHPSVAVETKL